MEEEMKEANFLDSINVSEKGELHCSNKGNLNSGNKRLLVYILRTYDSIYHRHEVYFISLF
jgi:hypothetical protein